MNPFVYSCAHPYVHPFARPRPADYMDRLAEDLCEYYGYIRELADMFLQMFSPSECVEFMEASDQSRPLVIRTNTLKTRRKDLAQVPYEFDLPTFAGDD